MIIINILRDLCNVLIERKLERIWPEFVKQYRFKIDFQLHGVELMYANLIYFNTMQLLVNAYIMEVYTVSHTVQCVCVQYLL